MSSHAQCSPGVILLENETHGTLDSTKRFELLSRLLADGVRVRRHPGPASDAGELPEEIAAIVACSAEHCGDDNGKPLSLPLGEIIFAANLSVDQIVSQVRTAIEKREETVATKWQPWFPVIDHKRCVNCKQCLSFCLFGVYALNDDGQVEVRNPQNCKTGCPACSRVCPHLAIVFPKYDDTPINGAEPTEDDLKRKPVSVDMSKIASQGIHDALRKRSASTTSAAGNAKDLQQLKDQLDIPDHVLDNLPKQCACQQGLTPQEETPASNDQQSDADSSNQSSPAKQWDI